MQSLKTSLTNWLHKAEAGLGNGGITEAHLAELRALVARAEPRQRVLYLHARGPGIYAPVIGMAEHVPVAGFEDKIRTRTEWPYNTVHDALVDGWQILQAPVQMSPFHDRDLDYVGYEFILHRVEEVIT